MFERENGACVDDSSIVDYGRMLVIDVRAYVDNSFNFERTLILGGGESCDGDLSGVPTLGGFWGSQGVKSD